MEDFSKFSDLTFDKFRSMATDETLSSNEKIGFPDSYRQGKEHAIFSDILIKCPLLRSMGKMILEIGPGCGILPNLLIDLCKNQQHNLILIDSKEMMDHLPDYRFIEKLPGRYPDDFSSFISEHYGKIDILLAYSVIQYIFAESNLWAFLDKSLALLRDGGTFLIGDIPNISQRKRFFSSKTGVSYHQNFTGTLEIPDIRYNVLESGNIDDSVVIALVNRARNQGFDAWIMPQASNLPMANRREDILIRKP